MSFILNEPPSQIAREAKEKANDEDEPKKKTREDYKKMKELEEARKAGTVPAMQDEQGKDINPHIPQYIMSAPWYMGTKVPTLRHQRVHEEKQKVYAKINAWQKKGVKEGPVATKFRKGACENCGAMTHKKIDCLERPRKIGAKFTGDDIAPDEHVPQNVSFDYDGKRDQWKSYDTDEHNEKLQQDHEKIEEAKRQMKTQKLDEMIESGQTSDMKIQDGDEDELKYADDVDMPGQKFETKQRITVRNLRIREDTAKYLLNLDVNSAYYDPKTRSMRENPLAGTQKDPTSSFQGDNFVRASGDANNMAVDQSFAWEAYDRGADVHLQADPTKLELLKKEYKNRKDDHEDKKKHSILEKYGGVEHLEAPPKQLLLAQTENYVEYSRTGAVVKGQEKAVVRSRYEEDVLFNNHTAVWGSYWCSGQWGYKCCHSFIKESYCTGEKGRAAASKSSTLQGMAPAEQQEQQEPEEEEEPEKTLFEQHQESLQKKRDKKKMKKKKKTLAKKQKKRKQESSSSSDSSSTSSSSSSSDNDSSSESDEEAAKERRIKEIMRKQEKEEKQAKAMLKMNERKRPFNSMVETKEPTEEEMEAFRRRQKRTDDPMFQFL